MFCCGSMLGLGFSERALQNVCIISIYWANFFTVEPVLGGHPRWMAGWPLNTSLTTQCTEFRLKILLILILGEKRGFEITGKIILSFIGTVQLSVTVKYRWRTIKVGLCKGWPRLLKVKIITVIKRKRIWDFDKWLLNTAPLNAGSFDYYFTHNFRRED